MSRIIASVVVAYVLMGMNAGASAQRVTPAPLPSTPAASQTLQAPYAPRNPDRSAAQSSPLFRIGQVPVVLWAPVQPPYNSKVNRSQAANPLWDVDAF
jgi:hypothetical protein